MANAQEGDGEPAEPLLPIVAAPKLDGSEADEDASEPIGDTAAQASLSRSLRFALLAACIASAAALGSFVGSLSASGVTRLWPGAAASSTVAATNTLQATKSAELAELAALKANLDGAARGANSQFGKLADRLDRVERVQIEAATKLAHVADAMDRLEKKSVTASAAPTAPAAPETTGSIANSQPAAAPAGLDRAGCARRSRVGREQPRRRFRRHSRRYDPRARPCRDDQAPGRAMDRRHRARADLVFALIQPVPQRHHRA